MKSFFAACVAVCAFAPPTAEAQSFSCRYASRADEITICQNS